MFQRLWANGFLVLVAVTWPLWIPWINGSGQYPHVSSWGQTPDVLMHGLDLIAVVMIAIAVALLSKHPCPTGSPSRWRWWPIAAAIALMVALDHQRLQPWAYQTLFYALVLGALPWDSARKWITAISVSIYLYSALGKIDFQFAHTVGREMVQAMSSPFGGIASALATKLAFMMPIGELVIAVCIAVPKLRRIGGCLAMAMHITLIVLLGPLLLNHSYGVLAWNTLLALQAWVLFIRPSGESQSSMSSKENSVGVSKWIVRLACVVMLAMPLAERIGYWDHWTSWALYSPHNSRAKIEIHETGIGKLPETSAKYIVEDADGDRWHELDIESWSFHQRWVPIYPQARYQIALAHALAKQSEINREIRLHVKEVSDRKTGQREQRFLIGRREIEAELDRYWIVGWGVE